MSRINIPKNPDQVIALCKNIQAKHEADGTASLLASLDMANMGTQTTQADTQNQRSTQMYRDAAEATQNRDLIIGADNAVKGTLTFYLRSVRDVLGGLYKGNEQKLGEWGFDVSSSPQGTGGTSPAPAAKP